MNNLAQRKILIGVTGGIAAYKTPDLVRRLRENGAEVRVAMTRAATAFVTPLTLQAVSGNRVHTELFDLDAEAAMGHIELARWAELVVVAPASCDFLARLAQGRADELLSALCLATSAPVLAAPAMNQQMWNAAATQANVALLRKRSIGILGPGEGSQACGEWGPGRMLEPGEILDAVAAHFPADGLCGCRVVITAGPTREPIDPVRYISNRSSGKMGYAIAQAMRETGAEVVLISGPTSIPAPVGVQVIPVSTAAEMSQAVMTEIEDAQIFIGAAAVADYRAAAIETQKLKRSSADRALALVQNPDILAAVANRQPRPFVVGFAAETENVEDNAQTKLKSKRLDLLAANDVSRPDLGFDSDENELFVFWENGRRVLPRGSKIPLARQLVLLIVERYRATG